MSDCETLGADNLFWNTCKHVRKEGNLIMDILSSWLDPVPALMTF